MRLVQDMLPEVALRLFLLFHLLQQGIAITISGVECPSDDIAEETIVSATCYWDGRMNVSWGSNEGIKIFYNCTGETEQQGRIFGWASHKGTRSSIINIDGWNYYNSTCYVYGCYADEEHYSTYIIPSVPCTVLTPPVLPTSTFIPSFLTQTVKSTYEDLTSSLLPTSSFIPWFLTPTEDTYGVDSVGLLGDNFFSSSTHPSLQQTSLLITAATVSALVVAAFSIVFLILFVGAVLRRANTHRLYCLHKVPFPVEDEGNIESKIHTQDDRTQHTDSTESIFNKFVETDADISKVSTMAGGSATSVVDSDAVSECKTVPGEEVEEEAEEGDNNGGPLKELDQTHEMNLDQEAKSMETMFPGDPGFHTVSNGYTSVSTSGQTSEYWYPSSNTNTVSTNDMEYALGLQDLEALCDEVFVDSDLAMTAALRQEDSSLTDSPNSSRCCPHHHGEASSNIRQESKTLFHLQEELEVQCSDSPNIQQGSVSGDRSSSCDDGSVDSETRNSAIIHPRSGSESNKNCVGQGRVKQGKQANKDIQNNPSST